jgi:hypothetical protein
MAYRDHEPITLEDFKGLFQRGDVEDTPMDHFAECDNLQSVGELGFGWRWGVGPHQDVLAPLANLRRIYNYPTNTGNTILVLIANGADGQIYHVVDDSTVFGPVLTITGMTDFAFVPYNGRAYISPFTTYQVGGLNVEKGLQNEFLYVYAGDGTAARKAAGATPAGTLTIGNGAAGHTDAGVHTFGVVGQTDTGYLSAPIALNSFVTGPALSVSFSTIPTFVGAQWTKRHIVASKVIQTYNGDVAGYQFFFIPGATINDNVTTTLSNISFYDQDLLLDASHLIDNFSQIAAGTTLINYHNRLILGGEYNNISLYRVSAPGEPEAISQITGILTMPPDGNPITNGVVLRDVFYGFKRSKTASWVDNGDEPTTWPYQSVDEALGTPVHGVGTVLDSGSSNADYIFIATYKGMCLFNGRYVLPELSYKIQSNWYGMDRNEFRKIQVLHDPITQRVYYITTDRTIMVGDYTNGLDPKNIKWWPWSFIFYINTIAIVNIDQLILGTDQV